MLDFQRVAKKWRSGAAVLALALLGAGASAPAQANLIGRCEGSFYSHRFDGPYAHAWADRYCEVREGIYEKWEPKLAKLDAGWRDLSKAAEAENWSAYRAKWAELLPAMRELEAGAKASPVGDAKRLLSLYREEMGERLFIGGFGSAPDLDSCSERLLAALEGRQGWVAARVGVYVALESIGLGRNFAEGAAAREAEKIVVEHRKNISKAPPKP